MERLAALSPDAVRIVGEELEKYGRERDDLRGQLRQLDGAIRLAEALLLGLQGSHRRLLLPSTEPACRSRILARVTAPEAVRNYLKQMIQQVTVHVDGRVVVEGTCSPLVVLRG